MSLVLIFFIINNLFAQSVIYFDGNSAMEYLIKQCNLGPRYPGSQGHINAIKFYRDHFNKYSKDVTLFEDYVIHPHSLDSIKLTTLFPLGG